METYSYDVSNKLFKSQLVSYCVLKAKHALGKEECSSKLKARSMSLSVFSLGPWCHLLLCLLLALHCVLGKWE